MQGSRRAEQCLKNDNATIQEGNKSPNFNLDTPWPTITSFGSHSLILMVKMLMNVVRKK